MTSAARTVVDIARTARFESAVVVADAALKTGLCTREKLREDALRAQPGVRTVVRWTWRDIDEFDELATRLRDLLGRR